MKVIIDLTVYNKLVAREEILNQLCELKTPTANAQAVTTWYNDFFNIISSFNNLYFPDYDDELIEDIKITLSKKTYDYYLFVQMVFIQIKNTKCASTDYNGLVAYHNLVVTYIATYKRKVKQKNADIEEFNTLVKLASEKSILKKKNVELEAKLEANLADIKSVINSSKAKVNTSRTAKK